MGRLATTRARVLCTVAFVVLAPLSSLVEAELLLASGAPALHALSGLVVAYLLSVGPRGLVAVVPAYALDLLLITDVGVVPALVVGAAAAALAGPAVLLLEARFRHHGRVRTLGTVVDFGLVGGLALPLAYAGVVGLGVGAWGTAAPSVPSLAAAAGIGVLGLTAGLRMLLMQERVGLEASSLAAVGASTALTAIAAVATIQVRGIDALVDSQFIVIPTLVIALLLGTAAYAIATTAAIVAILVPVALLGHAAGWDIAVAMHWVWWAIALVGLVLGVEGDRRRSATRRFQTFFASSATPTAELLAGDGTITMANGALAEMTGLDEGELAGRPLADFLPEDPELRAKLDGLLRGDLQQCTDEFAFQRPDGEPRWVRCRAVRIDLGGPQADAVQVQFTDLTLERDRQRSLQQSNDALESFGRRVSHDLKQPLSSIVGYANTLRQHAAQLDPDVLRTMLTRLDVVARRVSTQLDDTLAAASLAGYKVPVSKLHDVVASVVGVVEIDLAEAGGAVDTALAVARVQADPTVLGQVLLNLLTNSLKYARSDVPPRIRIASRIRGDGVEVTVTDNGTGIPHGDLERVFQRGLRLAPERAEGRGEGLADSRDLAEAAGGWLRAEPWADGARFVLWLPDSTVVGAAPATRVLIVDDEKDARDVLATRLSMAPAIEVAGTATTIADAVRATRELRPDVVLLDRWLNDEDGLSGVVELARAHPDVRVILLTSDLTPGLAERARSGGVLRTLDKSTSDEALVAELVGVTT